MTEFVNALIPKLLGETHFQGPLVIDCAHCALRPRPQERQMPCMIIAQVHVFQKKGINSRISPRPQLVQKLYTFLDYTAEVMEQWWMFNEVICLK